MRRSRERHTWSRVSLMTAQAIHAQPEEAKKVIPEAERVVRETDAEYRAEDRLRSQASVRLPSARKESRRRTERRRPAPARA